MYEDQSGVKLGKMFGSSMQIAYKDEHATGY